MIDDPIVAEVRAIRARLAGKYDYDPFSIFADIKRQERESGREYTTLPPRKACGDTDQMTPPTPRP